MELKSWSEFSKKNCQTKWGWSDARLSSFSYHSLVKMWRETEKKPVVWVWRAARRIINQWSDKHRHSQVLCFWISPLAQMNGFRGCGKGSQGDLPAPTEEMFPTVHPQRTRVFSQRIAPHPQQRRGTQKPSLSWDQGAQPELWFKFLLSLLTGCMSEHMLQNLSKPQLSPIVNWG